MRISSRLATICCLIVLMMATLAEGVTVKYSGILGQSQQANATPIPTTGFSAVAIDAAGQLWAASNKFVYSFTRGEGDTWNLSGTLNLPSPLRLQCGVWDGSRLFLCCWNGKLCALDPSSKQVKQVCTVTDTIKAFTVTPEGVTAGFATMGKFFTLEGTTVKAYKEDGTGGDTVLTLPTLPNATYCALGFEPSSGDLLVGTYYPHMTVFRYTVNGAAVTGDGWPRTNIFSDHLIYLNGVAWTVGAGNVRSLSAKQQAVTNEKRLAMENAWCYYGNDLVADPNGGYWFASSQGLCRFDAEGAPTHVRVGGLTDVKLLAVGDDGTLLAYTTDGRMVRMNIADEANTAFTSNGNEPWRVGAGWNGSCISLDAEGAQFLIADDKQKAIWLFDPAKTGWNQKPWIKLATATALTAPKAVSSGDMLLWILDGGQLYEAKKGMTLLTLTGVTLPGINIGDITSLHAVGDTELIIVTGKQVKAFTRNAQGAYASAWTSTATFSNISNLVAAQDYAAVLDKDNKTVTLLSTATGAVLDTVTGEKIPGGWQPGCLTMDNSWLFVSDDQGKRIIRLKISK